MENIEYACTPEEIGYLFPKRKWFEKKNINRTVRILLREAEYNQPGRIPTICLCIREHGDYDAAAREKITESLWPEDWEQLVLAVINGMAIPVSRFQELVLFDGDETRNYANILPYTAGNLNRLTLITNQPFLYEQAFDQIYEDSGLVADAQDHFFAMTGANECDKPFYQHQKYRMERCLYIAGNCEKKVPLRGFQKDGFFLDMTFNGKWEHEVCVKRPDMTYYSLASNER